MARIEKFVLRKTYDGRKYGAVIVEGPKAIRSTIFTQENLYHYYSVIKNTFPQTFLILSSKTLKVVRAF